MWRGTFGEEEGGKWQWRGGAWTKTENDVSALMVTVDKDEDCSGGGGRVLDSLEWKKRQQKDGKCKGEWKWKLFNRH